MANPYTITVTFDQENVNNTPDTYQLILVFTVDIEGSTRAETNKEKNLEITDHGTLEWQFEIEDGLLMPGEMTLQISDPDQYIFGLMFGTTAEQEGTRKQFQVEVKINGTTDFIGLVVEDEIEFDHAESLFNFTATPEIDIINKTSIYNEENNPLDPLGYTVEQAASITVAVSRENPNEDQVEINHVADPGMDTGDIIKITGCTGMTDLNRTFTVKEKVSNSILRVELLTEQLLIAGGVVIETRLATFRSYHSLIDEIYQLVDPSVSISGGQIDASGPKWKNNTNTTIREFITGAVRDTPTSGKVRITVVSSGGWVAGDDIFIRRVAGMTDLNAEFTIDTIPDATHIDVPLTTTQIWTSGGTIVKLDPSLATWGSGTQYSDNATFGPLTLFDHGMRNLGDVLRTISRDWFCYTGMVHQKKAFFKRLYEYQSSNKQTLGIVLERKTEYLFGLIDYVRMQHYAEDVPFFEAGTITNLEHRALKIDNVLHGYFRVIGSHGFSDVRESGNAIFESKDPVLDNTALGWEPNGRLLARLYFDARNTMKKNRVEIFLVEGVGYDILKSVDHEGEGFWTIGLKKMFSKGLSELTCIYIEPS